MYFDKKLVVDKDHLRTWLDVDNRAFQFRVGIYPNWWTWDGSGHPMIKAGHQKVKEIFIDHIGIGPTPEDADPWISGLKIKKND